MSSDSVPMDYQHPEWSPRAMKVAGSARLLLMMLEGVELPRLADKEAKRLKERLTLLEEVSCGGEPDFIHKALRRTLTSPTTQPPSSESDQHTRNWINTEAIVQVVEDCVFNEETQERSDSPTARALSQGEEKP